MTPSVGRQVHYVSYGTPGGEYASVCRAATITEVGTWITVHTVEVPVLADGRRTRSVQQQWDDEACALEVHNPTGLFFKTCRHDEDKAAGTWHWPERVGD